MIPTDFSQSNCNYGPPEGMQESQVKTIRAFAGQAVGGSLDGVDVAIVAWLPTEQELEDLRQGKPVFVAFVGGVIPHYLCTNFEEACRVV